VFIAFEGVDLILHAGDIYTSECLDALERVAPVLAVEVPPTPADGDPRIKYKRVIVRLKQRVRAVRPRPGDCASPERLARAIAWVRCRLHPMPTGTGNCIEFLEYFH
jgi:hypothetical protein